MCCYANEEELGLGKIRENLKKGYCSECGKELKPLLQVRRDFDFQTGAPRVALLYPIRMICPSLRCWIKNGRFLDDHECYLEEDGKMTHQ